MRPEDDFDPTPTADLMAKGYSGLTDRIRKEVPKLASLEPPAVGEAAELDTAACAHGLHTIETSLESLWPVD